MGRFDMLGSIPLAEYERRMGMASEEIDSRVAAVATLAGGAVGAFLWGILPTSKHPFLGLLNGMALAGNVARVATKEIPLARAAENLGAHAVATASSLALNRGGDSWVRGMIGYVAGAAGSNIVFKKPGVGYIERLDETVLGAPSEVIDMLPGIKKLFNKQQAMPKTVEAIGVDEAPSDGPPSGTNVFLDPATVTVVQKELVKEHPEVKADGVVGPITKGALRDYNTKHATASDGPYITERTLSAMKINPLGSPVIHVVSVNTAEPKTKLAREVVPRVDAVVDGDKRPSGPTIAGHPWWEVLLAGVGLLVAGGALYYGVIAN